MTTQTENQPKQVPAFVIYDQPLTCGRREFFPAENF